MVQQNVLIDALNSLENLGFYNVIIPLILVFVVVWGVLERVDIFGKRSKNINPLIALVFAFLFVRSQFFVEVVNQFLPKVGIYLIILMGFMILIGIVGGGAAWTNVPFYIIVVLSILAVFGSVFTSLPGYSGVGLNFLEGLSVADWWALGLLILLLAVVIIAMFSGNAETPDGFGVGRGRDDAGGHGRRHP